MPADGWAIFVQLSVFRPPVLLRDCSDGYECQNAHNHRCSLYRVLQFHRGLLLISATPDSLDWQLSALVKRFMAAMINTSSSVKPRVVIFHMTASQLVRSIAPLGKARAQEKLYLEEEIRSEMNFE